jgi:hypothetical protein
LLTFPQRFLINFPSFFNSQIFFIKVKYLLRNPKFDRFFREFVAVGYLHLHQPRLCCATILMFFLRPRAIKMSPAAHAPPTINYCAKSRYIGFFCVHIWPLAFLLLARKLDLLSCANNQSRRRLVCRTSGTRTNCLSSSHSALLYLPIVANNSYRTLS